MPDEMQLSPSIAKLLVAEKGSDLVPQWDKDADGLLSRKFFNKVRCNGMWRSPAVHVPKTRWAVRHRELLWNCLRVAPLWNASLAVNDGQEA